VLCDWLHSPTALSPWKNSAIHWTWNWVSPKAGPDVYEEQKNLLPLPGIEPRIVQPIRGYVKTIIIPALVAMVTRGSSAYRVLRWSELLVQNCALLGSFAACSGNFLPTFRDNLSAPSSRVKNPRPPTMGPICCPVRNHHYTLRSSPEERGTHLLRGGKLKSRLVTCLSYLDVLLFLAKNCTKNSTTLYIWTNKMH